MAVPTTIASTAPMVFWDSAYRRSSCKSLEPALRVAVRHGILREKFVAR